MREILFRGFHECENGTEIAVVNGTEYRGEWIEGDLLSKCSGSPKISIHGEYNRGLFVVDSYAIIPETVGQYTGLKDRNGKEIWEGDVVDGFAGEHYQGIWEYQNRFAIEFGWTQSMWDMLNCDRLEAIGTIFDKENG